MPFRSEAQRRYLYAKHPEIAKRWQEHTPAGTKLPEKVKKAFFDELVKIANAEAEAAYTPQQRALLRRRFQLLTDMMHREGVLAGTAHKRILVPKDKLTEQDIHELGFVPVTIAIPEAGQDRFQSFRHPDMNYHIHSHPEGWTMHEDAHAAATMLARKASGVTAKSKALVAGVPHVNEEGLPGLYYYLKGRLGGHKSTAQRVLSEMPQQLTKRIQHLRPSATYVASLPQAAYSGMKALSPSAGAST